MKLKLNENFLNIINKIYPDNKIEIDKYQKLFINENIEEKCDLFLNNVRIEFNDNVDKILKGDKVLNKTHFIQYIFPDKDIEMQCYNDIFKILLATNNSHCIFDIMVYTTENSFFIHIEDGTYEINEFDSSLFFTEEKFDEFINKTNNIRNKYKNLNSIFVFSGHGNTWYLEKDPDNVLSFNMINKIFDKYKLKFDLICFDACYTSSVEILYQFYNHSKYIIAHQSYEYAQDINSKYIPIIFDNNLEFHKKLQICCIEYLERCVSDGYHSSISLINCDKFDKFINLFKEHLPNIQKIMNSNKALNYVADLCRDSYNCSNIVDLYNILLLYNNKDLIDMFKNFVFYKNNNIQFNKRVYNEHDNFGGVNIVIDYNKLISNANNSYDKISFYKYRIKNL